jgi:uncharacterized protein with HEPN domain
VDWSSVIGLGNILRHEYHMVDLDTLWVILTLTCLRWARRLSE